jgi:hypothetical protein
MVKLIEPLKRAAREWLTGWVTRKVEAVTAEFGANPQDYQLVEQKGEQVTHAKGQARLALFDLSIQLLGQLPESVGLG